jgi:hypothetical protein
MRQYTYPSPLQFQVTQHRGRAITDIAIIISAEMIVNNLYPSGPSVGPP